MSIRHAGILGSIAPATRVSQGLKSGAEVEPTLEAAAVSTAIYCVIGYIVEKLAGWIVLDSARAELARAWTAHSPAPQRMQSLNS